MTSEVIELFESFFFGGGITSLIALLFMLVLIFGFNRMWRYAGIFSMVILVYIASEYLTRLSATGNFAWHLILVFLAVIFSAFQVAQGGND